MICVESKPRGEESNLVGPIEVISRHMEFRSLDRLWCLGYLAMWLVISHRHS